MGIPIWCLIAPMFLISAKAGLHDVVAQSFYEKPPSSSPAPTVRTQSHHVMFGMKEAILFLTPDQVQTLQAAGAVVQPYPEYENYFNALQQQFRQSVEQQNVQQYQTWMNPVEEQKDNADVINYFKHLNIQEINNELSQKTLATEATTEKTTTTPRYKYIKARQQYKEKEFSTPYAPKKASRTKITDQSNNAKTYVRFLPHYEHENLQMVPYQALPLSPYQFARIEANAYIETNEEAQVHSQANAMAQPVVFNMNNETAQPNTFTNVNSEAQQNSFNFSNSEVQQSEFNAANEMVQQSAFHLSNTVTPQPAFNAANTDSPQKVLIQISTEANRNALSQDNIVSKQNAFFQETAEAQQNAYSQKTAEAQQNLYSRPNKENQRNVYKPTRPSREQVPNGTKKLQGLEKVPASLVTPGKTYFVSQGKEDFQETLSSIEGLAPLLPLTPVTPVERQQEKLATPASTLPIPQTSILHKDRFSLLLAPLYQHLTITDTISRQKEELLKIEYNIRTKLQKIKESPQYYDPWEYNAELEKLTKNLNEQNALARIGASTVTPTVFATQGSVSTESQPIELVRSTETPTIVRIPKPHDFNIPPPFILYL